MRSELSVVVGVVVHVLLIHAEVRVECESTLFPPQLCQCVHPNFAVLLLAYSQDN